MTHIRRMYEKAKVKADRIVCYRGFDNCIDNDFNCHCHNEKPCKDATKIYPPFTAEKQIELIKWLVRHRFNFMVYELAEKDFTFEVINKRLKPTSQFVSLSENNFEEGLAKVLNCFWQDLTEEEKQQVKGILE